MPKSKRDKKVSLTKTGRKGLALKQRIIEDVKNCVEQFTSVYVFTYSNMRTGVMQDIRQQWKPSKFIFGKNKIIAIGLGTTPENEAHDDLHKLSKCLKGQCGIFFTNSPKDEVLDWFSTFSAESYARSGFKATSSVKLEEGPLNQFSHSIEPYLRKCGLPTKLERGVVTLIKKYEVCTKGTVLTPEQAKILELLDIRMATFKLNCKGFWIKDKGFEQLSNKMIDDQRDANEEDSEEQMEEDES